jgi:glycosyltransferase involved in cell wall biosynthesis
MKILLLSRYDRLGASSRHRSYQYLAYLRSLGHVVEVSPLLSNLYVQRLYSGERRPIVEIGIAYMHRITQLLKSSSYDLIWLEYEAFPWVPHWLEVLLSGPASKIPCVVDYDDAIYHRYDQHASSLVRQVLGKKIDCVMREAALVIAGNEYIATRARNAGAKRVEIIPTVVNLDRYPVQPVPLNDMFTIGWIGTPQTWHYLMEVREALKTVCEGGMARVVIVGPTAINLEGVPFETRPWKEETEIQEISKFDVGIMPLVDSPWERGKCGYKLIQYMACSRPVIASPIGVNSSIVEHGTNGYLARSSEEWTTSLKALQANRSLRNRMGLAGRTKVEKHYCVSVMAPQFAQLLADAARGHR